MGCGCGEDKMDEFADTGAWVEMDYNGGNTYPITYSGYMRRKYRVSVRPGGLIRQTGVIAREAATILVHPDDVPKLKRVVEQRQALFTTATKPVLAAVVNVVEETPIAGTIDDLTAVSGVGKKTAEKLNAAGLHSFVDLVDADTESLAEAIGASVAAVSAWQLDAAQKLANNEEA